jgi:hypothetical protein
MVLAFHKIKGTVIYLDPNGGNIDAGGYFSLNGYSFQTDVNAVYDYLVCAAAGISLSVTPGCGGGAGTGTVLANGFSGGTGSFEYITISSISSADALSKLDNPATRIFIGGDTEYTFTSLGDATYYVAIMDYDGNKGVSSGAVVNCTPSLAYLFTATIGSYPCGYDLGSVAVYGYSGTPTYFTVGYTYYQSDGNYLNYTGSTSYPYYVDNQPESFTLTTVGTVWNGQGSCID